MISSIHNSTDELELLLIILISLVLIKLFDAIDTSCMAVVAE